MATLYALTNRLQELLVDIDHAERLTDGAPVDHIGVENLDAWIKAVAEEIESVNEQLEEKVDGYIKVMRQLDSDAEALKVEEKRFQERRRSLERHLERLKHHLTERLLATLQPDSKGRLRIDTQLAKAWLQQSPMSVDVDRCDLMALPEQFVEFQPKVKSKAIIDHIKATGEIPNGAELKADRWHLVVK